MGCRCAEISNLETIKEKLGNVPSRSSVFNEKIGFCKTELNCLKEDSWSAVKSTILKTDAELLSTMTDKLEEAHSKLMEAISQGLSKIEVNLGPMRVEDEAYHKSLEQ